MSGIETRVLVQMMFDHLYFLLLLPHLGALLQPLQVISLTWRFSALQHMWHPSLLVVVPSSTLHPQLPHCQKLRVLHQDAVKPQLQCVDMFYSHQYGLIFIHFVSFLDRTYSIRLLNLGPKIPRAACLARQFYVYCERKGRQGPKSRPVKSRTQSVSSA